MFLWWKVFIHCSTGDYGQHGDDYILHRSGLVNVLRGNVIFLGLKVLGDSAYPNNDFIISVYKGHHLPPASSACNVVMCLIRICVEWGSEKIVCVGYKPRKSCGWIVRSPVICEFWLIQVNENKMWSLMLMRMKCGIWCYEIELWRKFLKESSWE